VWVNNEARWRKLSAKELRNLTKLNEGSVCSAIATNLFHLDATQYQSLKNSLNSTVNGLEGIYKKDNMYALVVRLPVHLPSQRRKIAKLVSLPTLAVTSAGTLAYKVYNRIHPRGIAWRQCQRNYQFYSEKYWGNCRDALFCAQYSKQFENDRSDSALVAVKAVQLLAKYASLEHHWFMIVKWISKNFTDLEKLNNPWLEQQQLIDILWQYLAILRKQENVTAGNRGGALATYIATLEKIQKYYMESKNLPQPEKDKLDSERQQSYDLWERRKNIAASKE
jgi:hypothetical protein